MKKAFSVITALSLLLAFGSVISLSYTSKDKAQEALAYDSSLYDDCEAAVAKKDKAALYEALKVASATGYHDLSYDGLWNAYKTVDVENNIIKDIYSSTTSYTPGTNQCGSYSGEGGCYNREHTIPKSWWGKAESAQGSDIFIVYPSDGFVNNRRSNYPFGEVSSPTYSSNNGYSKLGNNTFSGYSGIVFEPNDEWKGDMARVYFYTRVKWYNVPMTSAEGTSCFSGSQSTNYGLSNYGKNLFLKWSTNDPVSTWESGRNDRAQAAQGNRNPFIDHPEYINYLWGTGFDDIAPTSITLSGTSSINVGGTTTLSVSTVPSNATKTVTWTSNDASVATVSNGTVTGVSAGTATITATSTVDTSVSGTFSITVTQGKTIESLAYTGTPTKTSYSAGDTFDPTGITVTAYYSDETSIDVTSDVTWDKLVAGTTATGRYSGLTVTVTGLTITSPEYYDIVPGDMPSAYPTSEADVTCASGLAIKVTNVANFGSGIQFKGNAGILRSTSSLNLGSITLTIQSGKSATNIAVYGLTTFGGSETKITGSSNVYDLSGYSYFKITNGSGAANFSSIRVELEQEEDPLEITPTSMNLLVGETQDITTNAKGTVSWSTNNSSVATVSNGTVTAIAAGTATITATYKGNNATCTVTVSDYISLSETEISLKAGEEHKLTATASSTVTWSTSSNLVATVDSDGLVTALSVGQITITATCGLKSATCEVTVTSKGINDGLSQNSPFTTAQAYDFIASSPSGTTTYYTKGIVTTIDTAYSSQYQNITVTITDIEDTSKSVTLFRMKSDSDPNITVGQYVTVSAEAKSYYIYNDGKYEIAKGTLVENEDISSEIYSKEFLNNLTCNAQGTSAPGLTYSWTALSNYYSKLTDSEKNNLLNATYSVSGSGNNTYVTAENKTEEVNAIAMYRYDYIVAKYSYTDFIGRNPTLQGATNKILSENSEMLIPLITLISLLSISSITGYIFINKKKHE